MLKDVFNLGSASPDSARRNTGHTAAPDKAPAVGAKRFRPGSKVPPSVLGVDLQIVGDVRTTGEVHIEGAVDGQVIAAGISVGERGSVNGAISGDSVAIGGQVKGRIRATELLLAAGAEIFGDVEYDTVQVQKGARIEGNLMRTNARGRQKARTPNLKILKSGPPPGAYQIPLANTATGPAQFARPTDAQDPDRGQAVAEA
ncbi:bactofilin family protein [Thiohalocapsa marina]|nr:polymer-forming cytoskeletal protein [Thiohalocapsa marina]